MTKLLGWVGFFLALLPISAFSQNGLDRGISLNQVLDQFSKVSGIHFAYNPDQFSTIIVDNANKETIDLIEFKKLLEKEEIQFLEVSDNRWLLKKFDLPSQKQEFITINGRVQEENREALVGALIFTEDAEYSSLTDLEGYFSINVRSDTPFKLCCQYLGYENTCIDIKNHDLADLQIELQPRMYEFEDVLIETKRIRVSINKVDDSEKMLIKSSEATNAALGNDVLRSVQLLSGVDATNDLSSALRIRASSDFQSLITLDGIPLYNPESAFGIFSAINPLAVEHSELYKNALPLEYGEFTGAYLACQGLTTQVDKVKFEIDINSLKTSVGLQVPINQRSQISGTFRKSNGKISNRQFYTQLRPERRKNPQFQDFQRPELLDTDLENSFFDSYLNYSNRSKNGRGLFSLSVYGSNDLSGSYYNDLNEWTRRNSNNILTIQENFDQIRLNRNVGSSIRYKYEFKDKSIFFTQFYSSRYLFVDSIFANVVIRNQNNSGAQINAYRSRVNNNVNDADVKFQYETNPEKNFSWKSGIDFRRIESQLSYRSNNVRPIQQMETVPSITPYSGFDFKYKERAHFNVGTRISFIADGRKRFVLNSPRASFSYKLKEGFFLKSSLSRNEQVFRPIEIEQQLGQNITVNVLAKSNIPILKTNQFTAGMSFENSIFKLNGDIYWRESDGIIEQVLEQPGININQDKVFANNGYKLIQGENRVIGMDLTAFIEYKKYYGIASYTYSLAGDRFEELFANRFLPAQNNRLHQFNLFNAYTSGKWTYSLTQIFGSGVYTLNRQALESNVNRKDVNPDRLFTQLPDYVRTDFTISYNVPIKYGAFDFDFSIFNLFNNKNINSEIYIYSLQDNNNIALGAAEVNLLSRVVTLGVRYKL